MIGPGTRAIITQSIIPENIGKEVEVVSRFGSFPVGSIIHFAGNSFVLGPRTGGKVLWVVQAVNSPMSALGPWPQDFPHWSLPVPEPYLMPLDGNGDEFVDEMIADLEGALRRKRAAAAAKLLGQIRSATP